MSVVDEVLDELAPSLTGKKVLVKPNCLMASPPEAGVTTHPSLVRALVNSLRRRGASVLVGDNPGARGYGAGGECFRISGLLDAAGESYVDLGRETVRVPLKSSFAARAIISRAVLEADYVVTVPKLKTHCLTLLTGAVKNMYGMLAGGEKVKFHSVAHGGRAFSEALVDIYTLRPPDLAVMDAVVAMEGDGPSHGTLRDVGLILASDSPVALDGAAALLIGSSPDRIDHLSIASERGFGPVSGPEVAVDGIIERVPGFRLPSTFRMGLASFLANRIVFRYLHRSRLRIDGEECTGCGECREACPSGAVAECGDIYAIVPSDCHQCFCCYELCPTGAVKVRGPLGALRR